jgi:hypothetical protein
VQAATAAVVEERGPGIRARTRGPRSGAARRGLRAGETPAAAPRARGAERRRAGPRAGPRSLEGQNQLEERSCKGSVRRAEQILGGAGVLARDRLTGLKMMGKVVELGARSLQGCAV